MSLLEIQQAFAGAVAAPGAAPVWIESADSEERIGVYRDTVRTVLVKALSLTYPTVQRLVGAEFFQWAAALYAVDHLPAAANLDGYGGRFAEFLDAHPACAELVYLPDVARLDWAVARALHADDADPLDTAALARVVESADAAAFSPHPAVSLLQCNYAVDEIWSAVLAEEPGALERIDIASSSRWLLIERRGPSPQVSRLTRDEFVFARALFGGESLADALSRVDAESAAPQWLAGHIAAGRIVGYRLAGIEGKP